MPCSGSSSCAACVSASSATPANCPALRRPAGEGRDMTMTDPIADMLTRIRNANVAMHDDVKMPSSKLKESLAAVLQKEGYIEGFSIAANEDRPGSTLTITMKYSP